MKQLYKNQKEQFRHEALENLNRAINAEMKLKKLEEAKNNKYEATVFCGNCGRVSEVLIPGTIPVLESECIACRKKGNIFTVSYYPKCNRNHF